jgi:hypothetical protein
MNAKQAKQSKWHGCNAMQCNAMHACALKAGKSPLTLPKKTKTVGKNPKKENKTTQYNTLQYNKDDGKKGPLKGAPHPCAFVPPPKHYYYIVSKQRRSSSSFCCWIDCFSLGVK